MPQTLLALLALMISALYSFNVVQRHVILQHVTIVRELEEMAASSAIETMEIIRSRKFDQAMDNLPPGTLNQPQGYMFFTPEDQFPVGAACIPFVMTGIACEYIEDFHQANIPPWPFELGGETIYFDIDITVSYVDDSIVQAAAQSLHKRVTVRVRDIWPGSDVQYMFQPVELSRVFSYSS